MKNEKNLKVLEYEDEVNMKEVINLLKKGYYIRSISTDVDGGSNPLVYIPSVKIYITLEGAEE